MKKFLFAAILFCSLLQAQEEKVIQSDSLKSWSVQGQNTLTLNQAAFSNWIGGGANNVGWIAGVNYSFTYERIKFFGKTLPFLVMDKIIHRESEAEKHRM